MKNKLVLTILSISLVLTVTACGTTSSNSEDDTSLTTEMGVSGTEGSALETEITESSEAADATEEAAATEEAEATEVSDATEAVEGTESVETTEDSGSTETENSAEEIPDISEVTVENEEDGITLLKALFGTEDAETGNQYVFIYLNTVTVDDVEYYAYTWSWAVDDHYSRLTDVFVSLDGSTIYEGDYDAEGSVFYSDNMLSE